MEEKLNVKIAKTATQRSIMDVTASLDYRKKNSKNEDVYKGSIIFSVTEVQSGKYEKAWVSKAKTKMLLHAMINHQFENVFGSNGFTDYGGSTKPTPRARILNIKMSPKKQFIFTISEGPGRLGENGSIQMAGKPEKSVQTYIAYHEGLQMAHEVYDYIRDEETKAMVNGKPLYTIMPAFSGNSAAQQTQSAPSAQQTQSAPSAPKTSSVSTKEQYQAKIAQMTDAQLKQMYEKIKDSSSAKDAELKKMIAEEAKKRRA